ncbi:dethiobiotin synthase [Testudinibacter aquarius]|uniref:ATP-dependent dethiobiotin synthetase BioD n=1 Tax=Testudinibacter aquarius TaxID=1524974 RepID=A0A4R3Y0Z1_9PAST|nr:dethiobiotin synthase [Testudinibacter aquarius]KAE9527136.1 dethiobiotin synthase [Testudinibacter aquarius]TCV85765.1 dethiobiotin synthase [Testudinibacter aquarius]TNG92034.1 dethiobiotin synthase [Testudinibacter aquarius]
MSCFFVTGTDTGVGKTVASRAIIQALRKQSCQIVGYKPIACGDGGYHPYLEATPEPQNQQNIDVLTLLESSGESLQYQDINSYTMPLEQEPGLNDFLEQPQLINIDKLNHDLKRLSLRYQTVLVEGTFGWLTPINRELDFSDWVSQHQMPVVLVVGIKEGCINHALLTVQAIAKSGVPLIGWVANRINPGLSNYSAIIELLSSKIEAPLLGQIPYLYHPEKQDLSGFMNNIDRLSYLQTIR